MAKKTSSAGTLGKVLEFLAWLTGVIVSLTIGVAMAQGALTLEPFLSAGITIFFGWVVVVTTLLGMVLAIISQFN